MRRRSVSQQSVSPRKPIVASAAVLDEQKPTIHVRRRSQFAAHNPDGQSVVSGAQIRPSGINVSRGVSDPCIMSEDINSPLTCSSGQSDPSSNPVSSNEDKSSFYAARNVESFSKSNPDTVSDPGKVISPPPASEDQIGTSIPNAKYACPSCGKEYKTGKWLSKHTC